MTPLGLEVELLATTLFLFLYDRSQLLHANEVIFEEIGQSWTYRFASDLLEIRGKHLFISNPCRLDSRYRLFYWTTDHLTDPCDGVDNEVADRTDTLLILLAYSSWILLFLALPGSLFLTQTNDIFIAVLSLIYISGFFTGISLYRKRANFDLSKGVARTIAIEIILCPAFAPNVLLKARPTRTSSSKLMAFAQRKLSPNAYESFVFCFIRIVDEELGCAPSESPRREGLVRLKGSLLKEFHE